MKVKELTEILSGVDPTMDVFCAVDSLDTSIKEGQILDLASGGVVNAKKFASKMVDRRLSTLVPKGQNRT